MRRRNHNSLSFNQKIFSPESFPIDVNTSSTQKKLITLNPKKIGLYLNYHETYSCPYYTDRVDLIAPEINRVAQFCRLFGFTVIFYSLNDAPSNYNVNNDNIPKDPPLHLQETSPLVQDKCLYDDFEKNPAPENGSIHHDILYSTSYDLFVNKHINVVYLAIEKKLSHVIVGGMKCNMWLPPLFEQLRAAGIQPIYMYDLSDVVFFREAQIEKIDTHTNALQHFWKWINKEYGMIVNHFAILDRPPTLNLNDQKITYDKNTEAYDFSDFYNSDL